MDNGSNKRGWVFLLLIILILAGGYFFWKSGGDKDLMANGFEGNLSSIDNSALIVKGVYTLDGASVRQGEMKSVKVMVTASTIIERESFDVPTTGEVFVVDELPKTVSTVTLEEMKADAENQTLGLMISASGNIFGKKTFTATKIVYRLPRSIPTQ
jgi:hypothetical protein